MRRRPLHAAARTGIVGVARAAGAEAAAAASRSGESLLLLRLLL